MGRRNRPLRGLGLALALTATMLVGVGQAAASTDYPGIAFFDPARGLWTMDGIGEFYYGNPGDRPLLCDWNGNGTDTVGLYRSSTGFLHLRQQNNFGIADISIFFGVPEDIPVCGDWDGDGDDTIGVYRPSTATFYLHNGLQTAYADIQFQFGPGHGVPIAGDWDGDGIDTVGLWQPWNGAYQLATQHSAGGQWTGRHGQPGDRIVVEDFDADGRDSLAVHRPSTGRLYVYGYGQQPGASTEFDPGSGPGFTLSGWTGGAPLEPEAPPPAPDPAPPPSDPPPAVPPGAVSVWPGDNIQAIVDSHPDGTTFYIRSGTHRMQRIRPKTGTAFIGEPGAVLNGSKVLTGWNRDGNQWWVGGQTQQGSVHGVCESYAPRCAQPEDLFIDGVRLEHVANRSQVGAGKWFFDYGADRIYIGQDPGGKTVETSVTEGAFYGDRNNVTISGLIVEKYANPAQHGAIDNRFNNADDGADNWLITGNEVRWNHGTGIKVGKNARVVNNHVHHNGQLGVG
ncbi:MAG: hypothetical protein KJO87_07685, partial [Acidimicrobiia bacterium]|nr:hypothetical protein [Acidimicrobiia bacterium]